MNRRPASLDEALELAAGGELRASSPVPEVTATDVARLEHLAQPTSALGELERYSLRRLLAGAVARREGR